MVNATATEQLAMIEQHLQTLYAPGEVIEIRAIDVPGWKQRPEVHAGFFDNYKKAAREAARLDQLRAMGVYTCGPLKPGLLLKANSRTKIPQKGDCACDSDITELHFVIFDIDPIRADNVTGISASESEREAAEKLKAHLYDWLRSHNWPEPISGSTGNGCSLDGLSLYHVAYSGTTDNGTWDRIMGFTGSLGAGRVRRVHSGSGPESALTAADLQGADEHVFTKRDNYVWNNDRSDCSALRKDVETEHFDKVWYDMKPPEGIILVRVGDKLVAASASVATAGSRR